MSKVHLAENIYFDSLTGDLQELIAVDRGVVNEDLGNGTGYATLGCLENDNG